MDWLGRLNRAEGPYDLGGAVAEVLHWRHQDELPDNAPHRHTYFEVCRVGRHGSGIYRVQGQDVPLGPGDVFVARPGVIHQIVNTTRPWMELYWVAYRLGPPPGRALAGLPSAFAESPLVIVPDDDGCVAAAWTAVRALAPAVGDDTLRHLVSTFLLVVAEAFSPAWMSGAAALPGSESPPTAARLALRYIHDNLDRPLGLEEVARQAGVSARHLSRLMRGVAGTSFHAYVLWARLHLAAHLLRRSDLAVKVIGLQAGYPDVHHFTRVFSRHIGCPPAAYRRGFDPAVPIVQTPGGLVQTQPAGGAVQ